MNVNSSTDVLIVGAGPTGLMMACQLAIRNIPFIIIDKTEDHTTQSRALVVQARSVEVFDQMGIAEKAIARGQVAKAIGAFFNGKKKLRIAVSNIGAGLTKFPYFLMLEQSLTESMLIGFLKTHGREVERRVQMVNIAQDPDEVSVVLKYPDGKEQPVKAKYVIGADGAHSTVREQLNIPFGGETYGESLFVLDCRAEVDIPHDEMYMSFANEAIGGFFPLTNGRWRILGNLPKELEEKETILFEDVEKDFASRTRMKVKLSDAHWISAYRSHHRYAATFRQGRCFLAGDAAHIHSPVGAQGMNTGLQDAHNLAWKLALVLGGKAGDGLLDTYTEERIAVAKNLVRTTDRVFHFVTSDNILLRVLRLYVVPVGLSILAPVFEKLKPLQRLAFRRVSEIGISYRKGSLAKNASLGRFPGRAPSPGDRLPYITFKAGDGTRTNIQEMTKGTFFCLLLFSESVTEEIDKVVSSFNGLLSIQRRSCTPHTNPLYKAFGIRNVGCYLVRPDMYIAYRANDLNAEHLERYLSRLLHK